MVLSITCYCICLIFVIFYYILICELLHVTAQAAASQPRRANKASHRPTNVTRTPDPVRNSRRAKESLQVSKYMYTTLKKR